MKEDIDTKTVDKAWFAMKAMLDQEMPVDSRRRRFVWWWLALLLLPLAAIGGYLAFDTYHENKQLEKDMSAPAMPYAGKKDGVAAPASGIVQAEATENMGHINDNQQSITIKPRKPRLGAIPMPNDKKIDVDAEKIEAPDRLDMPKTTLGTQEGELPNTGTVNAINRENKAEFAADKESPLELLQLPYQFAQLQLRPTVSTPSSVMDLPVETTITPTAKNGKWALGASTILGTQQLKAINTIGGGLSIQWQPFQRWGLRSGMYYANQSISTNAQPATTLDFAQYNEILNAGFEIKDIDGNTVSASNNYLGQTDAVVVPLSRLNMLEMPVLLSYQFHKKWKVLAGMTGSYYLGAKARKENYAANSLRLKAITDPAVQNLDDFLSANIKQWGADVQGGVAWEVGKGWEIGAFAKRPIVPLTSSSNPVPTNAFLDLSSANFKNRLPLTFLLQVNYCFARN